MAGFQPKEHFASGFVAKCMKCERLAEHPWPPGWLMASDGFICPTCAFPGQAWAEEAKS